MNRQSRSQVLAVLLNVLMAIIHLLAALGVLAKNASWQLAEIFPNDFYPAAFVFYAWISLYAFLIFYHLYDHNVIAPFKSEFARQYCAVADVGLIFISVVEMVRIYVLHQGLPGFSLILRMMTLLLLFRIALAYSGNPSRPFWGRVVFDLWLGFTEFLLVTDLAMTVSRIGVEQSFLQGEIGIALLIVLASSISIGLGVKSLSPASILAMFAAQLAVAVKQLAPTELDGRYPAAYITVILSLAALLAVFLVIIIKRRRKYWR